MGQAEIEEMKRLIDCPLLVAPNAYVNPNRDEEVFYGFVREYGERNGISIEDTLTTPIEDWQDNLSMVASYHTNWKRAPVVRFLTLLDSAGGLVLAPFFYPIIGGVNSITDEGESLIVRTPTYKGIWNSFAPGKVHEYMHAYHAILAKDLRTKGLIEINGYNDIDFHEPPIIMRVPSYEKVKKFERKVMRRMLKINNH